MTLKGYLEDPDRHSATDTSFLEASKMQINQP